MSEFERELAFYTELQRGMEKRALQRDPVIRGLIDELNALPNPTGTRPMTEAQAMPSEMVDIVGNVARAIEQERCAIAMEQAKGATISSSDASRRIARAAIEATRDFLEAESDKYVAAMIDAALSPPGER